MKQHRHAGPDEIVWIDGFLSARACEAITEELNYCFWSRSSVVSYRDGTWRSGVSNTRTSETTTAQWFSSALRRELARVDKRIERTLCEKPSTFEGWQATRYGAGQRFDDHYDFGHCRHEPAGMRIATVLIYLQCPRAGGGTRFRDLDLEVDAVSGRLLYFRNVLPDGSDNLRMMHSGLPVERGRKVTLVNWVRERPLREAGKLEETCHE
jgi:prolyl 4-hydroxylase